MGKLVKRDSGDLAPEDDDEPTNPLQMVARSVSALESIAKSLIDRQDQSDAKIDALTKELAKTRKEARNANVMNSQAASEAEALNSLGIDLKGPIRYGRGGNGDLDNLEAHGEMIEGGKLPPESDPRF